VAHARPGDLLAGLGQADGRRRGWSLEQLNNYNRERFEDLISASWDLVIIDESHRMGGSTEQVARYKLGAALAEASPYLLLLSATPHQGKTDQFMRLMQLMDRDSFPDEGSVSRDRVRPFVIRTEKRIDRCRRPAAVQAPCHPAAGGGVAAGTGAAAPVRGGDRLRAPRLQPGTGGQAAPHRLLDDPDAAAGDVQHGSHSHHAGEAPALLDEPQPQASLFDSTEMDEWAELDGQSQVDIAVQTSGWVAGEGRGGPAADLARETEAQGTDAKAEALLELIYKLQQEENDPTMKV
jgi:hypothetical protein